LILHQPRQALHEKRLVGVSFLTTGSAHSATAALRRLVQDANPPDRVFLITDERTGLPLGRMGAEHYKQLHQRGHQRFRHLQLTFSEYAELDALQGIVGLARSGDLEIDLPGGQARPVSPEEVIASHQRQGRYRAAPILRDLLTDMPAGPRQARADTNSETLVVSESFAPSP